MKNIKTCRRKHSAVYLYNIRMHMHVFLCACVCVCVSARSYKKIQCTQTDGP